MKDYYRILGVQPNASSDEIKSSYRKLATQWHPDKNKDPAANEKFQAINEAYNTLKTPDKRSKYDHARQGGGPTRFHSSPDGTDFNDILNDVFNAHFNARNQPPPQYRSYTGSRQQTFNVHISLEEAFSGAERNLNGNAIRIPAGVRNNSLVNINNMLIRVSVHPHKLFTRVDDDLYLNVRINAFDAMLGTQLELQHIDGKAYDIGVPEGTQFGHTLRMKGKGMPSPEIAGKYGNLLIHFEIDIPLGLTEEQKSAILSIYKPAKLTTEDDHVR